MNQNLHDFDGKYEMKCNLIIICAFVKFFFSGAYNWGIQLYIIPKS